MAAVEGDFTGVAKAAGGGDVKDQWGNLGAAIQALTAIFLGKISNGTEPTDALTGFYFGIDGQSTNHKDWRLFVNSSGHLVIDENTGTEGTPVWTNRLTLTAGSGFDSSDVDHDATTNFVANEHIDHSAVSVTAGTGLSGGGTIAATRTIDLDLASLTTAASASGDAIAFVDANDSNNPKKTLVSSFISDQGIAGTSNSNEWSSVQGSTESTPSSSSGTLTLDFSASNLFEVTLTENVTTLTITNKTIPGWRTLILTQDASTPRTFAWSGIVWPGGTAPTISAGTSDVDVYSFLVAADGTVYGFTGGQDFS